MENPRVLSLLLVLGLTLAAPASSDAQLRTASQPKIEIVHIYTKCGAPFATKVAIDNTGTMPARGTIRAGDSGTPVPFDVPAGQRKQLTVRGGERLDCRTALPKVKVVVAGAKGRVLFEQLMGPNLFFVNKQFPKPDESVVDVFIDRVRMQVVCDQQIKLHMDLDMNKGGERGRVSYMLAYGAQVERSEILMNAGGDATIHLEGPTLDCSEGLSAIRYAVDSPAGSKGTVGWSDIQLMFR